MVNLREVFSLAIPSGATMVRLEWKTLTFMGLQIAGKYICGNCAP